MSKDQVISGGLRPQAVGVGYIFCGINRVYNGHTYNCKA